MQEACKSGQLFASVAFCRLRLAKIVHHSTCLQLRRDARCSEVGAVHGIFPAIVGRDSDRRVRISSPKVYAIPLSTGTAKRPYYSRPKTPVNVGPPLLEVPYNEFRDRPIQDQGNDWKVLCNVF